MAGGTYTLLIELANDATVTVGAAGERPLSAGWYAYTGSALGPGGFARVDRHRRVAKGEHDVRHWHVDHVLGHSVSALAAAVRSPELDAECPVARAVAEATEPVPGVGATDCDCGSHLAFATRSQLLRGAVRRAHELAGSGRDRAIPLAEIR